MPTLPVPLESPTPLVYPPTLLPTATTTPSATASATSVVELTAEVTEEQPVPIEVNPIEDAAYAGAMQAGDTSYTVTFEGDPDFNAAYAPIAGGSTVDLVSQLGIPGNPGNSAHDREYQPINQWSTWGRTAALSVPIAPDCTTITSVSFDYYFHRSRDYSVWAGIFVLDSYGPVNYDAPPPALAFRQNAVGGASFNQWLTFELSFGPVQVSVPPDSSIYVHAGMGTQDRYSLSYVYIDNITYTCAPPTPTPSPTNTPTPTPTFTPTQIPSTELDIAGTMLPVPTASVLVSMSGQSSPVFEIPFDDAVGPCTSLPSDRAACVRYALAALHTAFMQLTGEPPTLWDILTIAYNGEFGFPREIYSLNDPGPVAMREAFARNLFDQGTGGCRYVPVSGTFDCSESNLVQWLSTVHSLYAKVIPLDDNGALCLHPCEPTRVRVDVAALFGVPTAEFNKSVALAITEFQTNPVPGKNDLRQYIEVSNSAFRWESEVLELFQPAVYLPGGWHTGQSSDHASKWGNQVLAPPGTTDLPANPEWVWRESFHYWSNPSDVKTRLDNERNGQPPYCTLLFVVATSAGGIAVGNC